MSTKRVSSFIFRIILPAAVLCLIAAAVVSCGHKHSASAASTVGAHGYAPSSPSQTQGGQPSAPTVALADVLKQIDAYAPSGVDAARLATLKTELKKLLQARSKDGKTVSVAPTGPDNAVTDLAAMSNQQGTKADVVWTEKLKGDYNNDGVVDIRDIMPIALYYGQRTDSQPDDAHRLVNGDQNPVIDIGDLAAVAANYGAHIEGYQVWRGHWNGTSVDWETTIRPNPNPANPNWSADRPVVPPVNARPPYGYMDDISGVADKTNVRYKVVPYGDGASGVESSVAALSGSGLANSAWPKVHGDVRNSGLSTAVGPQTNALKWNYKVSAYDSPVIGADGTVYVDDVVTNDVDVIGCVVAIHGSDGTLKWETQLKPNGNFTVTSLAVAADGMVYAASSDGNLYALNPGDGSVKWTLSTGVSPVGDLTIGTDGVVYFGSGTSVCAVNPDSTLKWSYAVGENVYWAPAVGADGTLYAVRGALSNLDTHGLVAINSANGSLRWQAQVTGVSSSVGADGSLYVVGDYAWNGFFCLNSTDGSIRWSLASGSYTSLATGPDGIIYLMGESAALAVDPATGTVKWTFNFPGPPLYGSYSTPAVGADGTVYVVSPDGILSALSPLDGSVKWKYATGAFVDSSPAIGADGSLYLACGDGRLYAFGVGPKFSVSGVVTGPSGGLGGILVTITPGGFSATTLADGTYQIQSVPNGTYTVMAMKTGYTFSPLYPSITVSNADAVQNFTAAPGGLALAPWPKLHGTAGNTGLSPYVGAQTNHISWRKDFGNATDASPIVGAGGIVFACAGPGAPLLALDARDGGVAWESTRSLHGETPAIGSDSTIYTPHNSMESYIDATNPLDGTQIWVWGLYDNVEAIAIGIDGSVLTEAGYSSKTLYAFYPADGTTLWNDQLQVGWPSCPAVGADGAIYVAGLSVVCFDKTGNSKWSTMLGNSAHPDIALVSPSVGPSGDVYVKTVKNSSYELSLYALSGSDGSVKWKFLTSPVDTLTSMSVPAVGPDGTIYFGSEDHCIYALNPADGSLKWKLLTGGKVLSSAAIGADNTVYIGSDDSNVYALNGADGSIKWVYATSSWIHSSPAIGADGTVYVMTHNGALYAFGS